MEPAIKSPETKVNPLVGRLNIIDTETTGLDPRTDRIISLGVVEMLDGKIVNQQEWFFNPGDTPIHPEALKVHGITPEFLEDKPPIKEHLPVILGLLAEALVGGHNVKFDIDMLDAELRRHRFKPLGHYIAGTVDTMQESKARWPGKPASLDALCERVGVSTAHRSKHGALMDAELCALALMGMHREQKSFDAIFEEMQQAPSPEVADIDIASLPMVVLKATPEELAAHDAYLVGMLAESGNTPIWLQSDASAAAQPSEPAPAVEAEPEEDQGHIEEMTIPF